MEVLLRLCELICLSDRSRRDLNLDLIPALSQVGKLVMVDLQGLQRLEVKQE